MKRLSILILLSVIWSGVWAQQGGQAFNLDQCLQYALTHSTLTGNANLDEQIAVARVKEIRGQGLPQVSSAVALNHNEKLRRFFMANSTNSSSPIFQPVPGAEDGDVVASQNFFQLKSSGDAGVTINQLIFNGNYFVGLQAAKAVKDYSLKDTQVTKETLVQNVLKAYYAVLITRERVSLFDANIGRVDTLLRNTIELNKNGFAESIDVDRIRVQLNKLKTDRSNFDSQNIIVVELLKFQMNYPMDQPLEVLGKIEDVKALEADPALYAEGWDYRKDANFVLLEARHTLQQLNIKSNYAGGLPVISGFANIGYATQSNNISGLFKTNTTGVQDNGIIGPDKWYGYSMFGVSLSWNMFTGLQRTYKIQQEKLSLQKLENGLVLLKSTIDLDTKRSSLNYNDALKTLRSEKENMDLAENVARVTKIKYTEGVGSNIEVTTAENDLKQAQVNYYNALINAMLAKVDLDKAFGRLPIPVTEEAK
jgi:outer membrane protein